MNYTDPILLTTDCLALGGDVLRDRSLALLRGCQAGCRFCCRSHDELALGQSMSDQVDSLPHIDVREQIRLISHTDRPDQHKFVYSRFSLGNDGLCVEMPYTQDSIAGENVN